MDAKDLRGMAVVTMAEAERLGRVQEVLFETAPLRAHALRLDTERGERLVALSDIQNVGTDAIIAADRAAASASEPGLAEDRMTSLGDLSAFKVVDETGTLVGQVTRVEIDAASGDVKAIDVQRRTTFGIGSETTTLTADRVVSVGQDLITVHRQSSTEPA